MAVLFGGAFLRQSNADRLATEAAALLSDATTKQIRIVSAPRRWLVLGIASYREAEAYLASNINEVSHLITIRDGWTEPLDAGFQSEQSARPIPPKSYPTTVSQPPLAPESSGGDWAGVLVDTLSGECTLLRSLSGVRPLFYVPADSTDVVWSSSLEWLLGTSWRPRQLSYDYLADYAGPECLPRIDSTPYKGVYRLRPGHFMTSGPQTPCTKQMPFAKLTDAPRRTLENAPAEELRQLIDCAVLKRLKGESDPVLWLSGGLDSSALLCSWLSLQEHGASVPQPRLWHRHFGGQGDELDYVHRLESHFRVHVEVQSVTDEAWLFKDFEQAPSVAQPEPALLGGIGLREYGAHRDHVQLVGYMGDELFNANMAVLADCLRVGDWGALRRQLHSGANAGLGYFALINRHIIGSLVRHEADKRIAATAWNGWLTAAFKARTGYEHRIRSRLRLPAASSYEQAQRMWTVIEGLGHCESPAASTTRAPLADPDVIRHALSLDPVTVGIREDGKRVLRAAFPDLPEAVLRRATKATHNEYLYAGIEREWTRLSRRFERLALVEIGVCNRRHLLEDLLSLRFGQSRDIVQTMRLIALELFLQQKLFEESWDIA